MKVCIVSMRLPSFYGVTERTEFGGAEVQAAFVADALHANGAEISLAVADLPAGASLPYPAECAFSTHDGIPGLRFFHPRWSGIASALARADADVYYQHCVGMITGLVARFCRQRGRVFVYGAGSDGDFDPRKVTIAGTRDRMLFRYGLHHASGIVVQNRTQQASAAALGKPIRLIPTGVRPADADEHGVHDAIVWIGSLWTLKRPDRLLELARRIPERKFFIVGGDFPAEQSYSTGIREDAARLPNVTLTGRIPNDQVQSILGRAAVLINTSDVEGFPNAYLEAWTQCVPVIARRDIDGIIESSGAGVIAATVDDMERAIRLLDDERRRTMGETARRYALEHYSPQRLGAEYLDFFQGLIDDRTGRSARSAPTRQL